MNPFRRFPFVLRFPAALALMGVSLSAAEPPPNTDAPGGRVGGQFRVEFRDEAGRLASVLTGSGATLRTGGEVLLDTVGLLGLDPEGRTNFIIHGARCVFHANEKRAYSPEPLRLLSGDGRLELTGRGFAWWQTNNLILVSNDVHTTVRHARDPARPPLRVNAARLAARLDSNQVEFIQRVQVRDPQMDLDCDRLVLRRSAGEVPEDIRATGNVRILLHRDGSRVRAGEARYRLTEQAEWIELSGQPEWTDGQRTAQAERFIFDRRANRLHALGGARIRLPRSPAGLLATLPPGVTTDPEAQAELSAESIRLGLPATNAPLQELVAETNVQIRLPDQAFTARAHRASFTPPDLIRLEGDPSWSWRDWSGSGSRFEVRTNGAFLVEGHARLRFPLSALPPTASRSNTIATTGIAPRATNLFVEVTCDRIESAGQTARFTGRVQARCLRQDEVLGTLTARQLEVRYGERLETVRAHGQVEFHQQLLAPETGLRRVRRLTAEELIARLAEGARIETIEASGGVHGRQSEWRPGEPRPLESSISCDRVVLRPTPAADQLERLLATGNVQITHGPRMAWGAQADYTAADGLLRLTGSPVALSPEGRLLGADELRWNTRTGRVGGRGRFRSWWQEVPLQTNTIRRLLEPDRRPASSRP